MRRVLGMGVALGLAAALFSRCSGHDEFCDLARDDGLVAARLDTADQRQRYRARLDDADASAPGALADDLDVLRDAAAPAGERSALTPRERSGARANIDTWVAENCS
ncbi:MAG: hypothetical protein ACRDO7_11270 [Nocardioidaceae bacterium]